MLCSVHVEHIGWEGRVDMLFLGEALSEGAEVAGVGHVGVDVQLGVGVEGESGVTIDAPGGVCED